MENEFARSPLMRNSSGDPEFVENREIDFTMLIPSSLAENNTSGPLTVFGHGLFGDGDSYAMNARSIANEYQTVVIATDFKGWSSDGDLDAMTFALMDLKEFQTGVMEHPVTSNIFQKKKIDAILVFFRG